MSEPIKIGNVLPDVFDLKKYRGIETVYRGIEFRSRLEARWAAFFDQCGWAWNYEPYDLDGWIPDFSLGPRGTLVEIKPFTEMSQWMDEISKIEKATKCNRPVVLFGESPLHWIDCQKDFAPMIGWLLDEYETADDEDVPCMEYNLWELNFGFTETDRGYSDLLGLCSLEGGWWNIIHKPPDGISHPNKWSRVHLSGDAVEDVLVAKWAAACNATKWKPPVEGYR